MSQVKATLADILLQRQVSRSFARAFIPRTKITFIRQTSHIVSRPQHIFRARRLTDLIPAAHNMCVQCHKLTRHTPVQRPFARAVARSKYLGWTHMASAEREPITGVWRRSPHRGPWAEIVGLVSISGATSSKSGVDMSTRRRRHWPLVRDYPGEPAAERQKRIWILLKQIDSEWQWHQLGHMQVCTSPQTDNLASTQFCTGRMPFLPPNQQRQSTEGTCHDKLQLAQSVVWVRGGGGNSRAETVGGERFRAEYSEC